MFFLARLNSFVPVMFKNLVNQILLTRCVKGKIEIEDTEIVFFIDKTKSRDSQDSQGH